MKKTLVFSIMILMLSSLAFATGDLVLERHSSSVTSPVSTREDPAHSLTATLLNYNDVELEWLEPGAASILWDQIDGEGETIGKSAQDFEANYNAYDAEVAGDFVLDEMAVITGAAFAFFYAQAGIIEDYDEPVYFNVGIYPDEEGVPGETAIFSTTTDEVLPDEFDIFQVEFDEETILNTGTYWIGFNMRLDYSPSSVQCYAFQKVSVINETPGYWRNPGDGFETGFTTWTADILSQGEEPEDITFQLHGYYLTGNRELLGYDVYRNDEAINPALVTDTEYEDLGLNEGDYEYYIVAVYDTGDAPPSNTASVSVTLYPPTEFAANSAGSNVICTWQLPGESRNLTGYHVYRNGEVVGNVTNTFFVDLNVPSGVHEYYATALYGEYESEASNVVIVDHTDADDTLIPIATALNGNYPNPFNPETTISYSLQETGYVNLEIYNLKGQKIRTLVNSEEEAGVYNVVWDGTNDEGITVPSGIYFSKFATGDYSSTMKMVLMK